MSGVLKQLQQAAGGSSNLTQLQQAAAGPEDIARQTGASFVNEAATAFETLLRAGSRIQTALPAWMGGTPDDMVLGQPTKPVVENVPGQEDRFYSKVAGMAGQTAVLAPAALGGPVALAGAGTMMGAEQGIEDAQAHNASSEDVTYSALGNAFLGAATTFGPLKALSRFKLPPASHSVVLDALEAAGVGTAQTLGADAIAKATYDPQRVIDVGKAVEAGLAMGVVGGGTSGTVKLLEVAASRRAQSAPKESPEKAQSTPTDQPTPDVRGAEPIPGMPEEAPATLQESGRNPVVPVQEPRSIPEETGGVSAADSGAPPRAVKAPPEASTAPLTPEPAPAPESTIRAPIVEEPVRDAGAVSEPLPDAPEREAMPGERSEAFAEQGPDQPVRVTKEQAAIGEDTDTIALRHETTAAKRAARGFPEYERNPSKTDVELRQKALDELTADPFAGRKLVERIASSDHKPSDAESFLLLAEANRLRNEVKLADVEFLKDPSPENKALLDSLNAEFQRALDVTDRVGSEQGKAFRVRAQQMREDYTLAGVVRKKAKGLGRALTDAEMRSASETARKLDELERRIVEAERKNDENEANILAQKKIDALKREVRQRDIAQPRRHTDRVARNRARMDEIVREFAKPSAGANPFLDPAKLKALVEYAALSIENGVLKFADFASDLTAKLGDSAKPYLQSAWDEAVKAHREGLVAPIRERVKAGEKPNRQMHALARHLVEQGVTEREALIDAAHKLVPEMSREQVRDAISGYGQYRLASKEEADVTLRKLKQEMQKVAQIEALEKKLAPLKTGFERGEMSDEARRLQKRVEELKKQVGIRNVDPERALKTAEQTRERYLTNRIADLKHEIATGKREAREAGKPPTTPEIARLEAELAIVQAEHADVFAKPKPTEAEKAKKREEAAIKAVERTARHYEARVRDWDVGPREKPTPIDSPEYRAAVAHRDAARAVLDELRSLADPKLTPEQRANKAALTRLANETAAIQQRITFREFGEPVKREPIKPSSDVVKARAARDEMKRQLAKEIHDDKMARRKPWEKARDLALDLVFQVPKALYSAFDFSAVGRQGMPLTAQDIAIPWRLPGTAVRMGRMFRAFASEPYANRIRASIEAHGNYELSQRSGLELTGFNNGLSKREEVFRSSIAEHVPLVKASERAYVTWLDLQRFEHWNRLIAGSDGSPEAAKSLARLVNQATGRGTVGKGAFAKTVDASGAVLWAPRLYVSRFQLLYGDSIIRGTNARKQIIAEYAKSLGSIAALYSLVAIYNSTDPEEKATVSLDPRDSDGGKIKIGNTRMDPLAGLAQTSRLATREGIAAFESATNEGKSKENPFSIGIDFLANKFSPSITVPYELATGRELSLYGRKVDRSDPWTYAPLAFQDVYKVMQDQGVPRGTALTILSLFGVGMSVYEKKGDKPPASREPVATR